MGLFDELRKHLGVDDSENDIMVPPPPDEKTRRLLDFVKEQEPAIQHGHDEKSRGVIDRALEVGRSTIPPPPAAPPPDEMAKLSPRFSDPRDAINTAAEAGAVATNQFPPQASKLAALLRQAGRGVNRLQDTAEKPFPWERPTSDVPGQQSVEPDAGPNASVSPPASFQPGGNRESAAPPAKRTPDTGHADLMAAIDKAARPPEQAAETPAPAQGERPSSSTVDNASPATNGPLDSLAQKLGDDPRTARLKEAIAQATEMKRMANHVQGMGIGADLVEGTHVHGDQGKGLRDQADDLVSNAMLPTQFEQKNQRFDTEQAASSQSMRLKDSAERRAALADTRAGAKDTREQRKSDTEAGLSDATSQTSANARAAAEATYPKLWAKIPQSIRDQYSSEDVKRLFGEVTMKDFAPAGPGRQGAMDTRQARTLAAHAKLPNAGTIHDLNDVLATMDAGKAPGTGYFMNENGWQNFLRSPDGVAFRQKTQAIINRHIKETTGLQVRESEEGRLMGELGYGKWDDANALESGLRKMAEEKQAEMDQELGKLPPEASKMLEDQGAVPKIGGEHGKAIRGSTRNFGDQDNFNPREWLRKKLNLAEDNPILGHLSGQ